MSILERNDRPFGVARRMPDGNIAVPKFGGIVDRRPPAITNATVEIASTASLGPAEIHARALAEEKEATFQCLDRLLRAGRLDSVISSAK